MSYVSILLEHKNYGKQFLSLERYFHPERPASSYSISVRKKGLC